MKTFDEYQNSLSQFDVYPRDKHQRMYYTLGMCGEAGEVAEKIKKLYRDRNGKFDEQFVRELENEIGDVLWYMTRLAESFSTTLENCATANIRKLSDRLNRGKLHGDGSSR